MNKNCVDWAYLHTGDGMKRILFFIILAATFIGINGCGKLEEKEEDDMKNSIEINELGLSSIKEIYLAGGCFWGVEGYFNRLDGILGTQVGYVNGNTEETSYEALKETDHVEALYIEYDENKISLTEIIDHFFRIIDPTSLNKQGNDIGRQYRTGVYSNDEEVLEKVRQLIELKKSDYPEEIVVEVEKLKNYVVAEEYHQDYLQKNPTGYCHIDLSLADKPLYKSYEKPDDKLIKERLDDIQYDVTQNSATERPFTSELDDHYEKGIYVDIVTGEPLFSSTSKFDAGCGWPSFSKPITSYSIEYIEDKSHGMNRIEVKSKSGDSHLGHVFEDGPQDEGGLRYCINGASLRFVPYEYMDAEGYSEYKKYVE